jgi:hypothetical protein
MLAVQSLVLDADQERKAEVILYGASKIKFNKENQLEVDSTASLKAKLANVRLMRLRSNALLVDASA